MKIPSTLLVIAIGLFVAYGCQYDQPQPSRVVRPLKTGDLFPEIDITAPKTPEAEAYLGLHNQDSFTLMDVQADVIVMEILNTHCFSCKKQARTYNKLFDLIRNDSRTDERIKILGIAVGNNANEVRKFQDEYQIPYPIVSDPNFQVHRAIGFSKTPYSLYIRKGPNNISARIVDTHFGANSHYKNLFNQLIAMLDADIGHSLSSKSADKSENADQELYLSKNEIEMRVRAAFRLLGGKPRYFKEISIPTPGYVYAAGFEKGAQIEKLFAVAINRVVPCDVCHDANFIYVFDKTGKILQFESIQLTKDGNELWDETDLYLLRSRILGKYIFQPVSFSPQVDAISSATITSAVIFNGFSDAQIVYDNLDEKGLLQ